MSTLDDLNCQSFREVMESDFEVRHQGGSVALKLVEYFRVHMRDEECPWSIFDRNLVEQVLQDHHLPQRFARFMPEDRTSEVGEMLDELLGHHPPSSLLVQLTADTILALARRGNVILIGRGANIITGGLENVLHVRLVASLERRIAHVQETHGLGRKAALDFISHEDRGRQRYLKKHFGRDPDDPKLYHLIINTDLVSYDQAAQMISGAALNGLQARVEQPSVPLLGARSESRLQR